MMNDKPILVDTKGMFNGEEAKNAAALFAAQVVGSIIGLVISVFIARKLGEVVFGKNSFALTFTAIFARGSGLGYDSLLIRESCKREIASKYLNNVLRTRALLSLVFFALIVITINMVVYPADTKDFVYLYLAFTHSLSLSLP